MKEVKIFTADWCSGCKSLKAQLKAKGVEYVEVDVDTEEGMKEGQQHAVRSLPTIILGDEQKLVGSDATVLKKIVEYVNG